VLGSHEVVRRSVAVAAWTVLSRLTGLVRLALIAAVLGPTYFGNTFQAVNQVPTLAYQLVVGSLLVSLLVPPLVHTIDTGAPRQVKELAGSLLGVAMAAFAGVSVLLAVSSPLVLHLLSAGIEEPAIAAAQRRAGVILLVAVLPQVVLYGVAAVGEAVQNAHGRFALAAAAPALENLCIIVTLGANLAIFGAGVAVEEASTAQLVLLGLGATAGVAVHAAAQWWGAWRVGVALVPNARWGSPEVRRVVRRALPMTGYAALTAVLHFALIVVSNRVPGGVVAFQVGLQLMYFPVAITSRSVSVTLLPQLSRLAAERALARFRDELVRAVSATSFVVVPAAVAYLALARPIATAIGLGEMATPRGVTLLAVSLAALAPAVLAEAAFVMGTAASYGRHDTRAPFDAKVLGVVVTLIGAVPALLLDGPAVLFFLGSATSAGGVLAASYLAFRVRASLPRHGQRLGAALVRAATASLLMAVPAHAVAVLAGRALSGPAGDIVALLLAAATGVGVYLGVQRLLGSPELRMWQSSLGRAAARARP
jgi:putative peptidoglycan lipid II flippase